MRTGDTVAVDTWEPPYRYQAVETDTGTVYRKVRLTPADVIDRLPADATPAQQDSAIQAHFRPHIVAPSARPDTLSLPGWEAKPFSVKTRPGDWQRGFFNDKPLFREELRVVQPGMAGDPVPYRLQSDDWLTGALLVSFLIVVRILTRSRFIIAQQIKNFFYPRERENLFDQSTGFELRGQLFLAFHTCVMLAILFFDYTQTEMTTVFREVSPYKLLGIDLGVIVLFFLLKVLGFLFVGWVFFDKKKNGLWLEAYSLVLATTGLLLFPLTLLVVYFDLSLFSAAVFAGIVGVLGEILLFFKANRIFFAEKFGWFKLLLYLCTMEMLPNVVLWQILKSINQNLVVI